MCQVLPKMIFFFCVQMFPTFLSWVSPFLLSIYLGAIRLGDNKDFAPDLDACGLSLTASSPRKACQGLIVSSDPRLVPFLMGANREEGWREEARGDTRGKMGTSNFKGLVESLDGTKKGEEIHVGWEVRGGVKEGDCAEEVEKYGVRERGRSESRA